MEMSKRIRKGFYIINTLKNRKLETSFIMQPKALFLLFTLYTIFLKAEACWHFGNS